ncbi:MAG: chemotaxis protein CheX [Armatimonadetes bacterium]|nr:chemotaxis protein CheX [Armatimonadota bacterium]MBX3108449.1 chemotaxis protein CheX [Fimbriimonadaceae bacterium]
MKVEYVTPFVAASVNVINTLIATTPERGKLSARPQLFTSQQVNIVCGITGEIEGQVIYGMSLLTAKNMASKMLGGMAVKEFDQLAASAIAELGNMISGGSSSKLFESGFKTDITPPTIVKGPNISMSNLDIPTLVIPLAIADVGELEIAVSLRARQAQAA